MSGDVRCAHCGVEVRKVNYALGEQWMHAPYPTHFGREYEFCRRTVATPPEEARPE